MIALTRMRIAGFLRAGRGLAPLITVLVALSILYGGGQARPAEAYGISAIVLFPVLAWQTKLLLDGEPDVQRKLARVTLGSPVREVVAGLLAAAAAGLAATVIAMALPWLLLGIELPEGGSLLTEMLLGFWAHLLALLAALVVGGLASRAVTRSTAIGVAVLVSVSVLAIVLGLKNSPLPWLAPPLMQASRLTVNASPTPVEVLLATAHALLWTFLFAAAYIRLRLRRP